MAANFQGRLEADGAVYDIKTTNDLKDGISELNRSFLQRRGKYKVKFIDTVNAMSSIGVM